MRPIGTAAFSHLGFFKTPPLVVARRPHPRRVARSHVARGDRDASVAGRAGLARQATAMAEPRPLDRLVSRYAGAPRRGRWRSPLHCARQALATGLRAHAVQPPDTLRPR